MANIEAVTTIIHFLWRSTFQNLLSLFLTQFFIYQNSCIFRWGWITWPLFGCHYSEDFHHIITEYIIRKLRKNYPFSSVCLKFAKIVAFGFIKYSLVKLTLFSHPAWFRPKNLRYIFFKKIKNIFNFLFQNDEKFRRLNW